MEIHLALATHDGTRRSYSTIVYICPLSFLELRLARPKLGEASCQIMIFDSRRLILHQILYKSNQMTVKGTKMVTTHGVKTALA